MLKVNLPLFRINKKEILRDIAFTLGDKENLTILGSNGAGKSTLAKTICGLYKSSRAIKIEKEFIEDIPDKKRSQLINYIPPKLSIYDEFIKVEDFLKLNGELNLTVLDILGLKKYRNRYCKELSSGEEQLLLLASATMHCAKLTIFDEPTSNLDPKKRRLVYGILKNSDYIKQKIIITHDLQLAYKFGYPILYIDNGIGEYFKSTDDFFNPLNLDKLFDKSVTKSGDNILVKV